MPSRFESAHTIPSFGSDALVADMGSQLGVVVTHPWGPLGGSLHNNVVAATVLYFQRLGVTTLRFNFAGWQVGRGYWQVKQVVEAANYLLSGTYNDASDDTSVEEGEDEKKKSQSPAPCYVLLVGYSYGSLIAASASASIPRCVGVISIAPPLAVKHWLLCFNSNYHMKEAKRRSELNRLMILGSQDNFTSEEVFFDNVESFPSQSTTGAVLKDADHFFARREKDLMSIIGQWLVATYPEINGDLRRLAHVELVGYVDNAKCDNEETRNKSGSFLKDCSVLDSACRY